MCLAVPSKVVELRANSMAMIEMQGLRKEVSIELVPEVQVGDYVLVHVGYALSKMDEESAIASIEALKELEASHGSH